VETAEIIEELKRRDYGYGLADRLLDLYREHYVLRQTQIAEMLDIDRRTVAARLTFMMHNGLIQKTVHGYRRTLALTEYLLPQD
jgi:DNA-binding transcriptional regulator LsrR (DeoR family)